MTVGSNAWKLRLDSYKSPDNRRATFELVVTSLLLAGLWAAMWLMAGVSAWLPALLANALYALAACLYSYSTFLGFTALPFLSHRTNLFLAPAAAALLVATVCSALQVNLAAVFLSDF